MRRWALELDGVEPARAVAEPGAPPARGAARRSPTACAAGTRRSGRPTSRSRSSRGVLLERRWVPLETVGIYVPRNLVSTLVMCAVPAQAAGVERIVVCTPPAGAGLVAAAAEVLGIDEVWALGGPQAIGWLAYVRQVDKIVGPGNAYVNEAKLEVQRDVAIDLPGGPSEVVVVAAGDVDPRIVELELAAQAEHGPDTRLPRRRDARGGGGARARAPRAARRGRGARRPRPQRRRGLRRPVLAGRRRRLRDRRQPRAADERLGALGRRARPRDVPQAGHDAAAHGRGARAASGPTVEALAAAEGMPAHAEAVRR